MGPKLAKAPFPQTFQHFTPFPKLIREIPLFWNLIFFKSSSKCKTWFLEHRVISNVDLEKFFFFFLNSSSMWSTQVHGNWIPFKFFQGTWVLHMELENFTWNSSSKKQILIFRFAITRLSKNRVLNWNSIFRKSSFKTKGVVTVPEAVPV